MKDIPIPEKILLQNYTQECHAEAGEKIRLLTAPFSTNQRYLKKFCKLQFILWDTWSG